MAEATTLVPETPGISETVPAAPPVLPSGASGQAQAVAASPPPPPAPEPPPSPAVLAPAAAPTLPPMPLKAFDAKKADEEAKRIEAAVKVVEAAPKPAEKATESAKAHEKPAETSGAEPKVQDPVPAEPFTFTDFTIPDEFQKEYQAGKDRIASFRDTLIKSDLNPQQRGQALLDMHAEAMRDYAAKVQKERDEAWYNTQKTWHNETLSHPVLGGAGHDTAMGVIARARDRGITDAGHKSRLDQALEWTGAGYNSAILELIYNLGVLTDEPQASQIPTGINPPKDNGARPGRKASVLYDRKG